MLAHRLRRWPNIEPILCQWILFAWLAGRRQSMAENSGRFVPGSVAGIPAGSVYTWIGTGLGAGPISQ